MSLWTINIQVVFYNPQNDGNVIGTNTASALTELRTQMFSTANGDRQGINNISFRIYAL